MPDNDWTYIGDVEVDAGCLLLLDPCYLRDILFPGNPAIESWYDRAVVDEINVHAHWPIRKDPDDSGEMALGHVVTTGHGDGSYPVEVRLTPSGAVAELRIRFLDSEGEAEGAS